MGAWLDRLFDPLGFTPHGFCLAWDPVLLWLHALSNAAVAAAYFSIPLAIAYFVRRRKDLAYPWVFWLFAAFITFCGLTHLMRLGTIWWPIYWLDGMIMAATAAVSAATAVALWPLLPRALALPSPQALRQTNQALERQIAERRALEARLIEAQRMEAVGQLSAGVAHDFNNIMMGVSGALQLLPTMAANDPRRARLQQGALEAVARGDRLVRQLLAFAATERVEPRLIDVGAVVSAMTGDLLAGTLGGRIRVHAEIANGLWPVAADRALLEAALLNLALNARDAMPEGGELTISAANHTIGAGERADPSGLPPGDYVALSVCDTGEGMPAEVAARAFEPFFTTKPFGVGTGLGLAQVHGFARQAGGAAQLRSEPGKGTCVILLLPRANSAQVP